MSAAESSFGAFLRELKVRPDHLSAFELRDALWLALRLQAPEASATTTTALPEARVERAADPTTASARPEEERESRPRPPTPAPSKSPANATLEPPSAGKERSGLLFRTPGASALPGVLALARALRPLRQRVRSQNRFEVDEEATALRISEARAGRGGPPVRGRVVVRPVKVRWFELAMVVDGAASMAIWERTIRELVRLFAQSGAFRDVRAWTLDSEGPRLQLHAGITRARDRPRSIREVIDSTGRRVILVLTDGVAAAWRDGRAPAALHAWSTQTPVALLSVLPEALWNGTVMRALPGLEVCAFRSGETRVRLQKVVGRRLRSLDPARFEGLPPIPVASLEPASLAKLAGMLTGTGSGSAVLPRLVDEVYGAGAAESGELTGEERVRRFDRVASPTAHRLARLFAMTPLFLPVMRLVQHTMLPASDQAHMAEVFLGGLLEEVTIGGANPEVDAIEYAFRPGVGATLRRTGEDLATTMAVLRTVSGFVAERIGRPLDFGAMLVDPTAKLPGVLGSDRVGRAFAWITAEVLRPLGGEYAALAERLGHVKGPENTAPEPTPAPMTYASFRGHVVLVAGTSRPRADAERWAAVAVGRRLARLGFGVASSHFEGVVHTVVDALMKTLVSTPAEQSRIHRERVSDFVTADVCAAIIVGGAQGTWSRVELARYLGIPVLPFAGTGGSAARLTREIDPDAQEIPLTTEIQAEAVAERLFAELLARVSEREALPPWMTPAHMATLRSYAISTVPDAVMLEMVQEALAAGRIELSLDETVGMLGDQRPELRAVAYLSERHRPRVALIESLAGAVVEEARTIVVVPYTGLNLLGLAALEQHCDHVTMLRDVDVVTRASQSIAQRLGAETLRGRLDGPVLARVARLGRRALTSPRLWTTIQAQTYERLRLEPMSDERTARLEEWADEVRGLADGDPGATPAALERLFQTGEDGGRALALACASENERMASVRMLFDGIKAPRSAFEQWLALNAALGWLPSAQDVDGIIGAVLEQVLDEGSRLSPSSNSDRAGIAEVLLSGYGERLGYGPGPQSASLRHRWLGEIQERSGDDDGARARFAEALLLAVHVVDGAQAGVALALLEARTGEDERARTELLHVLEKTEQVRGIGIEDVRFRALLEYARLSEASAVRKWVEAATEWGLPEPTLGNVEILVEGAQHLLLLAERLPADRAAQKACYRQALELAEALQSSPDFEFGDKMLSISKKARIGLARLGEEIPEAQDQEAVLAGEIPPVSGPEAAPTADLVVSGSDSEARPPGNRDDALAVAAAAVETPPEPPSPPLPESFAKLAPSGDQVAAAEIEHAFYTVTSAIKTRDLLDVIMVEDPARAIIFCNTRADTELVASVLRRDGFHAEALSSDLNQSQRERVMKLMRERKLRFLVATDVAARGIDIGNVSHVINYSVPESADLYVHRAGRAGRTGVVISLVTAREIGQFYYLKLQYSSIVFTGRHLPPPEKLAAERAERAERQAELAQADHDTVARDALTFLQARFPRATILQKKYPLLSGSNEPAIKQITGFVAADPAAGTKQLLLAINRLGSIGEAHSLASQLELFKTDLSGSTSITYSQLDDPHGNQITSDKLTWSGVVVLFTDLLAAPVMDIRTAFGNITIEIVDTSTRAPDLSHPGPNSGGITAEHSGDSGTLSAIEQGWQLLAQPDAERARAIFAEILNRAGPQKPVAAMLGMAVFHGLRAQTPSAAQWNSYLEAARSEAAHQQVPVELRRAVALWYGLFSQVAGRSHDCASALAFLRLHFGPAGSFTLPIPHVVSNVVNLIRPRGPGISRRLRPNRGRNINGDEGSRVSGLQAYSRLAAAMNAGLPLPDGDPLWRGLENNDGSAVWLIDNRKR